MAHTREDAWALVTEWTASDSLRNHALAVEAAMRFYAEKLGGDIELWGLAGLLHDFDYERYPEAPAHPTMGMNHLRSLGWSEAIIDAIAGHAPYLGVPRESLMAKALFAVDELCGMITAVAYVKPTRSIADVEVSSVKKKLKDKSFARSVSREDIALGVEELGIPLDEHIQNCITALQGVSESLGL